MEVPTNDHLESVVTKRGTTILYEEDNTYPSAGSAHYDQIIHKQITRMVINGSGFSTEHFYTTYSYDTANQLTFTQSYNGTYGSTESHYALSTPHGDSFTYDCVGTYVRGVYGVPRTPVPKGAAPHLSGPVL
jgi:hypothetical protein